MNLVIPLSEIKARHRSRIGGKGHALAEMFREGLRIPEAVCISTEAYREYLASTGMKDRIRMERNPLYWDARNVAVDTIDALAVTSPTTALNLYLTGEVVE